MIDTARHYYPVREILNHVDAMSAAKMNVLHVSRGLALVTHTLARSTLRRCVVLHVCG